MTRLAGFCSDILTGAPLVFLAWVGGPEVGAIFGGLPLFAACGLMAGAVLAAVRI
jgi:hypothetical protein